ncbi:MAG: hypothetical protein F6K59_30350 [Moorea sp. SIO3F7]|nr:hypothetical protein [Moorena sp. SIO3E8]NEQ03016.1 hypothetical protein [Moorena sp. SIO3F7]
MLWRIIYEIKEYNRFSGHRAAVYDLVFSPDGEMIASASGDKTIKLWQRDGTLLNTLEGHLEQVKGVAFSPDGKRLSEKSHLLHPSPRWSPNSGGLLQAN